MCLCAYHTEFGKSLSCQAISFVIDFKLGLSKLVVSPLVSLMVAQVEDYREGGK